MASHRARVSEPVGPVGVVELSAALLALAAVATELGAAAAAVALAAASMAEDNASVGSDDKPPPAKDATVASEDMPSFAKDASRVSSDKPHPAKEVHLVFPVSPQACPASPTSSHCSTPSSAGRQFWVEQNDEEKGEVWKPCPTEGKSTVVKPVPSNIPLPLTSPLHFRVVWDAKKASNVQRKDGLHVNSVAEFLADRMQASKRVVGWTIQCGPKDWELKVSVPQRDGSDVDSMLQDITGLVKDVVEAELESSRGNGGRNTIGSVRARPYDDEIGESAATPAPSFMTKQKSEPAPSNLRHSLRVKNTFIHVDDPQQSRNNRKRMSDPLGMCGVVPGFAASWSTQMNIEHVSSSEGR